MGPVHCGIQGSERADELAKQGAQRPKLCKHARVTRTWLPAKARLQLLTEWADKYPTEPLFPATLSDASEGPTRYSPASLRALFRTQTCTTPSHPFPNEASERCSCGGDRTSRHLLTGCRSLDEARNDLPSVEEPPEQPLENTPPQDLSLGQHHLPHLIAFLRGTGIGFRKELQDGIRVKDSEVEDIDTGPIGSLGLDLNL